MNEDQTPKICLAAVKQTGSALQYVRKHTLEPEICSESAQNLGSVQNLESVTPKICMTTLNVGSRLILLGGLIYMYFVTSTTSRSGGW